MYLFETHGIVQVHFNKTAGTSLRAYLESALGEAARTVLGKHHSLAAVYTAFGDRYPVITTVRNPYDRLVSLHAHRRKRYAHGARGAAEARLWAAHHLPFRDWLLDDLLPHAADGAPMDQPLSTFLSAADRVPRAVTVIRMEQLEAGTRAYLLNLGVTAPQRPPLLNTSPRAPWRTYYDDETLGLVYRWDRYVFDTYYPELAMPSGHAPAPSHGHDDAP